MKIVCRRLLWIFCMPAQCHFLQRSFWIWPILDKSSINGASRKFAMMKHEKLYDPSVPDHDSLLWFFSWQPILNMLSIYQASWQFKLMQDRKTSSQSIRLSLCFTCCSDGFYNQPMFDKRNVPLQFQVGMKVCTRAHIFLAAHSY